MTPAEELVCAIVRGDVTSWPLSDDDSLEQLVTAALHHNVHLILFDIIKKSPAWNRWPLRLRERLENEAATASALDLIGEQELRRVLIRLDEYGIQPLLLKGVPLAYTLYRSPTLRPRGDSDLLVRDSDLQSAGRIFTELGYDGPDAQTDKLTSYECLYRRKDSFGVDHYLDIHWKINNAELFAKTFTFDELIADAIEIPALASCARGLGCTHALLLACMHRFGHAHAPFYVSGNPVYAGDHLRWVYDIHLLCSALSTDRWSEFTTLARTKSIAAFCVDSLNAAKQAFNTQVPAEAMDALQTTAPDEATNAQRLRASRLAWFFANLRALPDLRQRIALIKQVALPPSAYMMKKYQVGNRLALPFLYGYRLARGVFKGFKRSKFRNT
jgi:Uncharacterised nucleotidyltransferase